MSNNNLTAAVERLKANTETVKKLLNKNQQATTAAINALTPAAAAGPAATAVKTANQIQTLAVQNQNIARRNGVPTNIAAVQVPAAAAMTAATSNATMANALAAQAAGAAPGSAATKAAVTAATASTNAALAGNVPAANKNAQNAATAAVNAVANASPAAKKIANRIKTNLMNNPERKSINTNANRGKVAANILNTKFNNGYVNKYGTEANFNRAYANLMKNGSPLSNAQKNVVKRAYFSYKLNTKGGSRRWAITENLKKYKNFKNFKEREEIQT